MLGNIRLVFSDIHIDMFSSKEEIEKAKYKICCYEKWLKCNILIPEYCSGIKM